MGPMDVDSTSFLSLKSIYGNAEESEISELKKQNNERFEQLFQQGHKEMIRRKKTESDAGSSADVNNSAAEDPVTEQIITEPAKSKTLTEGCTEIQDTCPNKNKFDWKQNTFDSQIEEPKLHALPKKSEKFKETLFKNSELLEGTRTRNNKNRKKPRQTEILDLSLTIQEKQKRASSKFNSEPPFVTSLLSVTNVWLQKRGADLFDESQHTRVSPISCNTATEEKILEMALAASSETAMKDGSMVDEKTNQIHKPLSTASTFIPPKPMENENWETDSTESEFTPQEFENENDSYNTTKPCTEMQEIANNNSGNICNDTHNDNIKSIKNGCNTYKIQINSNKNIEPTGGITEETEVSSIINNNATKNKCHNRNYNQRTYFASERTNRNILQEIKNIIKSNPCIKSFETDRTPTVSSSDTLEEVGVSGDKLIGKNIKHSEKCLDDTLITHKPAHNKDELSKGHFIKLNNREMKNINHKTHYFCSSHSTEPQLDTLPPEQGKTFSFETVSSKLINEGVHNSCEKNGTDHLKNITYEKASANSLIQLKKNNVMVNTGGKRETASKIDDQAKSSSNELGDPLMREVPIEQLLRYERVEKTVSHYSSNGQVPLFANPYTSVHPTTAGYGCSTMFPHNNIPLLQTTLNPVTNLGYNQFPTTDPRIKQGIPSGWAPYLSPGVQQPPSVIQTHITPNSILMGPQSAFLNPSQLLGHNFHVSQPLGALQQSDPVVKSKGAVQTRNCEPKLVSPPSSGSSCNPYFPAAVPQVVNPRQLSSKVTNGLLPELHSVNPYLSQASLQEVSYSQPPPPKAELYYQNLQNMIHVDLETLNQQMRNLLFQPVSVERPQTYSYGFTPDLGRPKDIQNVHQTTTVEQNMTQYYTELEQSQAGSSQSGMCIGNKSLNSHHQIPPPMCGNSSQVMWQHSVVPFTQLSRQNHSTYILPPTPEITHVENKGFTSITSLPLAAKGRGRHRNQDF